MQTGKPSTVAVALFAATVVLSCAVLVVSGVVGLQARRSPGALAAWSPFNSSPDAIPESPADVPSESPTPSESPPPSDTPSPGETLDEALPPLEVPPGGAVCSTVGVGPYATAVAGNDHTSCRFSSAVRNAYLRSGADGADVVLRVTSPVTHKTYDMACTGTDPVICTGGRDAVVLIGSLTGTTG